MPDTRFIGVDYDTQGSARFRTMESIVTEDGFTHLVRIEIRVYPAGGVHGNVSFMTPTGWQLLWQMGQSESTITPDLQKERKGKKGAIPQWEVKDFIADAAYLERMAVLSLTSADYPMSFDTPTPPVEAKAETSTNPFD